MFFLLRKNDKIVKKGKVRDLYQLKDNQLLIVATDRISAFDRHLGKIPGKGEVLNQVSAWWFNKTKHIINNHMIECATPNSMVVHECIVFPVEFVVRGYMCGRF